MRQPKFDPKKPCSWCNPCPASHCDCGPCQSQMCCICFPTGTSVTLPPKPVEFKPTRRSTAKTRAAQSSKDFVRGYACAVATLQRMDGSVLHTTEVRELCNAGGLTSKKFCLDNGVDEYDLEVLFPEKEKA